METLNTSKANYDEFGSDMTAFTEVQPTLDDRGKLIGDVRVSVMKPQLN